MKEFDLGSAKRKIESFKRDYLVRQNELEIQQKNEQEQQRQEEARKIRELKLADSRFPELKSQITHLLERVNAELFEGKGKISKWRYKRGEQHTHRYLDSQKVDTYKYESVERTRTHRASYHVTSLEITQFGSIYVYRFTPRNNSEIGDRKELIISDSNPTTVGGTCESGYYKGVHTVLMGKPDEEEVANSITNDLVDRAVGFQDDHYAGYTYSSSRS